MDKVRTLLFGMTGFGNNALEALKKYPAVDLIGVFIPPRQDTPFPYYKCEKLHDLAIKSGIALYEGFLLRDDKTYELISRLSPDLIVVSTFKQIFPNRVVLLPKLGVINVHASLLPKYRGATPTVWALMNGEEETGVTVHFIENEKIDQGRIIAQSPLKIELMDTDGSLRQRLAQLSEKVLKDAIGMILNRKNKEMFSEQNESEATYYPKRSFKDAEININRPFKEIANKIRAMSPYPGAYVNYNGIRYVVSGALLTDGKRVVSIGNIGTEEIMIKTVEGILKFQVKEMSESEKDN